MLIRVFNRLSGQVPGFNSDVALGCQIFIRLCLLSLMLIIVIGPAGSLSPVVTRKMFIADSSAVYLSRDRLSHRMVRRSLLAEAHLKLAR